MRIALLVLTALAGVGTVLLRYFKLLNNDRYHSILEKIYVDTDRAYSVFPGRFLGLAGLGGFLLDLHEFTGEQKYLDSAHAAAEGILRFRVERNGLGDDRAPAFGERFVDDVEICSGRS